MSQPLLLRVYCDGGARGNPGPAAVAYVIKDQTDHTLAEQAAFIGTATNNIAEYQAVILALTWIIGQPTLTNTHITFNLDSMLVANQLSGHYKIKQPHLLQLFHQTQQLTTRLTHPPHFSYIPREQNSRADFLLNQILDSHLVR